MENSETPKDKNEVNNENEKAENIQPSDELLINPLGLEENENLEEEEWDEEEQNLEEHDPMEDYGKSGEKYGWYNGFSDDAIDDAFEGDPENTWNVD